MNKKHNHPKPNKQKKLIDAKGDSYSPNSIGGRINLIELMEKLSFQVDTNQKKSDEKRTKDSEKSIQGKGKKE